MSDKRVNRDLVRNWILALIFVVTAGILAQNMAMEPVNTLAWEPTAGARAVAPYKGNAADGVTTTVNSTLVGGKTITNGAQSFLTDTDGALHVIPAGPSTVTLSAGDPLPITATTDLFVTLDGEVVAVDATGQGDVPVTLGGEEVTVANTDRNVTNTVSVSPTVNTPILPFAAIAETGLTQIIGPDESIAQYDWSDGTEIALGGSYSEELLNYTVVQSGTINQAWTMLVFDADPSVTAGDANMATASWDLVVAKIDGAAGDWFCENSGGTGCVATFEVPHAVHSLSSVWVAIYWKGATTLNSLAGDDEIISVNIWYRRDS